MSCSICWGHWLGQLGVVFEGQREMEWGHSQMTVLWCTRSHPFQRGVGKRRVDVTLDTWWQDGWWQTGTDTVWLPHRWQKLRGPRRIWKSLTGCIFIYLQWSLNGSFIYSTFYIFWFSVFMIKTKSQFDTSGLDLRPWYQMKGGGHKSNRMHLQRKVCPITETIQEPLHARACVGACMRGCPVSST